jgi:protein SCO1/2
MSLPRPVKFFGTIAIILGVIMAAVYIVTMPIREYAKRDDNAGTQSLEQNGALPILATVPEFALIDQNDQAFSMARLKGKIWLADMIFTKCETICPTMSTNFSALQSSLDREIRLVSFSVDPEYDKGEVLREYAQRFNADTTRWTFVTGHRPTIFSLAKTGFLLGVDSVGLTPDALVTHSEKFVLIDREGRMRGYYDGTDSTSAIKIKADIERLQAES